MTKFFPADVEKEVRALALPWLGCLTVIVLGSLQAPLFRGLEFPAYFLGVSVLGGLSMGHEYSHRTLPILLAQPVRRERLYFVKWGVLATLLLTTAMITAIVSGNRREFSDPLFLWLPVLCAFCVGPWLTMWARNPLAGVVFCMGLPGTIFIVLQLIYYWVTGDTLIDRIVLPRVIVAVCAIAAVMSWRTFMRLEAVDGGGRQLRLQAWPSAGVATVTRQRPTWLLIKKELGLQHLPLVLGVALIGFWIVGMTLRHRVAHVTEIFTVITVMYATSLALIIGLSASAEERQLGTHEWQMLLPVSAARQWSIKVAVSLVLSVSLSVALPAVLLYAINDGGIDLPPLRIDFVVGTALATSLGLYFSSLSTSGIRALVVAVPAIGLAVLPGSQLAEVRNVARFANGTLLRFQWEIGYRGLSYETRAQIVHGIVLLLAAAFIAIVLRFAFTNHRSAAPIGPHLWRQGLVIGGCISTAAFVLSVAAMFGMI